MDTKEIVDIEIDVLLEAIHRRYDYDFSKYARPSLNRRVQGFLMKEKLETPSQLIPNILRDKYLFDRFLAELSVTVTEFFRDPGFFNAVKETIFPILKTYPFFKIWHAGCATGEEVYSLAILLKEANLLGRARIYATDYNKQALSKAKSGVYPIKKLVDVESAYCDAGGNRRLTDYYTEADNEIKFNGSLQKDITFAYHNLVKDGVFGEMHMVICRNVLIYFDKDLRDHALTLFNNSLAKRGFICLGHKETLSYSVLHNEYNNLSGTNKIFRRVS
ncbi:MAG: chemotaxis protein CheR [Alteromonadaceae bacterium]|nr:MAG: chemotaxis protein CheR [Alteromonadaceae bacterium]